MLTRRLTSGRAILALALLAAPLAAEGQEAGRRTPRVGVLLQGEPSASIVLRETEAIRRGLQEHGGYVEGQNIAIEYRYGDLESVLLRADEVIQ